MPPACVARDRFFGDPSRYCAIQNRRDLLVNPVTLDKEAGEFGPNTSSLRAIRRRRQSRHVGSSPNWTEIAGACVLGAQLLVLLVAAGVAWYQARQAKCLREDQNRPFVVMDVDFVGTSELFLFVRNLGTSLARDVRIAIEPPLESSVEWIDVGKFKMLKDGISTLAPGKELRTFFDQGFRRDESDLPLVHTATITYSDDRRKRRFIESMELDIEQYMHLRFAVRKDLDDIHKQLTEINKSLARWTWSGGGSGLLTISRAEADVKNAERRAGVEEQRRKQEGGA